MNEAKPSREERLKKILEDLPLDMQKKVLEANSAMMKMSLSGKTFQIGFLAVVSIPRLTIPEETKIDLYEKALNLILLSGKIEMIEAFLAEPEPPNHLELSIAGVQVIKTMQTLQNQLSTMMSVLLNEQANK